jgi:hypothetical protein
MNRPDAASPSRRWRTPALIALGAWLAIEVLFLVQAMHVDSFDVLQAVRITHARSLLWVVFAPLAVWLAFRFPLERGRLTQNLAVHLAACAVLVAGSHFVHLDFPANGNVQSLPESGSLRRPRGGHPLARVALDLLLYVVIVSQ